MSIILEYYFLHIIHFNIIFNIILIFYSVSSRRAVRTFGRKYALTPTSYKFLEIGISVGAMSYMELILGDNKSGQIVLPFLTWHALMQKRADVERLVQSAAAPVEELHVKDGESLIHAEMQRASPVAPIWIHDLTIGAVIISDFTVVRFATSDGDSIYMKPSTVLHLFDFNECIEHMHLWLCQNIYPVGDKFERFVNVLQRNNITKVCDAVKTIRESDAFDSGSLVDCELITCAIHDVLYATAKKK